MKQVLNVTIDELKGMSEHMYDNLVKGVVDLNRKIVVVDAEMHVDEESYLLENGSLQADLWGFNLYPYKYGTDEFIEFDSMINIRPRANNRSRYVEDEKVRNSIVQLVSEVVHE